LDERQQYYKEDMRNAGEDILYIKGFSLKKPRWKSACRPLFRQEELRLMD
jgi:hypothetical protein